MGSQCSHYPVVLEFDASRISETVACPSYGSETILVVEKPDSKKTPESSVGDHQKERAADKSNEKHVGGCGISSRGKAKADRLHSVWHAPQPVDRRNSTPSAQAPPSKIAAPS
ncbi:MAG: hypothetical protein M2R45_03700 [Verrucomicrobia subdivision 3 bacterium]|nr:hypothetical protein [Limisphaerales bacterium]MCS1414983.1 hypothetical protein [Limisphaerales bacterium]